MLQMKQALIDLVQHQAWAIQEHMLDTINNILCAHLHGEHIAFEAVAVEPSNENQDNHVVSIKKKVAIIPIHGVLAKRLNLFSMISGGTSTELLKRDIQNAVDNPEIDALVLNIDSPGGTVDGTKELADLIFASREKKPIVAYGNGLMASAAYWIGSAAETITAFPTTEIGSIGVIATHYDYSEYDKNKGVKRTHIYAGKYKAMGNDAEPLSEEAKEYLQEIVHKYYTIFVDDTAKHRSVSSQDVLKKMADGKIFLAEDAKNLGMIDRIMNFEDTIELAARMAINKDTGNEDEIISTNSISYEEAYSI